MFPQTSKWNGYIKIKSTCGQRSGRGYIFFPIVRVEVRKISSQHHWNRTHNLMDTEQMLYWLSHSGSWFTWHNVICLRTMAKMQPCGLQPIEMLRCWLVLQPHSCRLSWQAAPALDLLLEKLNIQIVCWQYVMPCLFFLTRDVVFLSPYSAQWVLNTQKFYIPSALSIATSHSSHHIKVPWAYFLENLIA